MVLFPEKEIRKLQRASSSDKPIPVKIFEGFFEFALQALPNPTKISLWAWGVPVAQV